MSAELVELCIPADEVHLAVLRTTCTALLQPLQIPKETLEVLRNAVDSAAVEVLYEHCAAHSIQAALRVGAGVFEVDLLPWSESDSEPPQGRPASVDLRDADPAAEHVVIEPLLPKGVRVRRLLPTSAA